MVASNTPAADAPAEDVSVAADAPPAPPAPPRPVSERKKAANRANARKSTGPKTEEGKAVSRFNGLKHGVHAEFSLLPGEDPEELRLLMRALHRELFPRDTMQKILVDRIVSATWKLRRIAQGEAQAGDDMVAHVEYGNANRHLWGRREPYEDVTPGRAMCRGTDKDEELGRFIALELKLQRSMDQSLKMLMKLQEWERKAEERGVEIAPPGRSTWEESPATPPIQQNEPTADDAETPATEPPATEALATPADSAIQQNEATEQRVPSPNAVSEAAMASVWAEIEKMTRQNEATEPVPNIPRTTSEGANKPPNGS